MVKCTWVYTGTTRGEIGPSGGIKKMSTKNAGVFGCSRLSTELAGLVGIQRIAAFTVPAVAIEGRAIEREALSPGVAEAVPDPAPTRILQTAFQGSSER